MIQVTQIKLDTAMLDKFAATLNTNTDGALRTLAFQGEGYAKPLTPFKTGNLRDSIHVEPKGNMEYWVADGMEYGIYQELGTRFMAAHPFMVPAFEQLRKDIADVIRQAYK